MWLPAVEMTDSATRALPFETPSRKEGECVEHMYLSVDTCIYELRQVSISGHMYLYIKVECLHLWHVSINVDSANPTFITLLEQHVYGIYEDGFDIHVDTWQGLVTRGRVAWIDTPCLW